MKTPRNTTQPSVKSASVWDSRSRLRARERLRDKHQHRRPDEADEEMASIRLCRMPRQRPRLATYEREKQNQTVRHLLRLAVRVPGTGATRRAGSLHRRFVQRLASERHADDSAERRKVGEGTRAAARTLRIPVRGGRRVGGRPGGDRAYPESVRHGERGAGGCCEQVTCGGTSCKCFTRHAPTSPITEIINARESCCA